MSLGTVDGARSAITRLEETIDRVSKVRGDVGAVINRLTRTLDYTTGSIERITALSLLCGTLITLGKPHS